MTLDLSHTQAAIFVFAQPDCPACEEFMPVLAERVQARAREGFMLCHEGQCAIAPKQIPILIYDVTSTDKALGDLLQTYKVELTPTVLLLTRGGASRLDGALTRTQVDQLFDLARAQVR